MLGTYLQTLCKKINITKNIRTSNIRRYLCLEEIVPFLSLFRISHLDCPIDIVDKFTLERLVFSEINSEMVSLAQSIKNIGLENTVIDLLQEENIPLLSTI